MALYNIDRSILYYITRPCEASNGTLPKVVPLEKNNDIVDVKAYTLTSKHLDLGHGPKRH